MTDGVLSENMTEYWTKYKNSSLLQDDAYQAITEYVRNPDIQYRIAALQNSKTSAVFKQLLGFHEIEVIRYVLALIDQALRVQKSLGSLFAEPSVFLNLLKHEQARSDQFICWKSCRVLALLFSNILSENEHEAELREFLTLMMGQSMTAYQDSFLFALQGLLRKPHIRKIFSQQGGCDRLTTMLSNREASVQVQYQTIFCLWLLSFDKDIAARLQESVSRVVDVARQSQKEKVIRISLAALRNLATSQPNVERMVESKLQKQLEIWSNRRWGDEDIVADLANLTKTIERVVDEMSSFERYRAEVLSGDLEWTPVHFSETFWRDNITKLAENSFQLIRVLSELVKEPNTKSLTKAVACYDIGEFVRVHPAGRSVVNDLGTKKTIMQLLYHEGTDPEVQKQALLCTRKMMVSNWQSSTK
eukprot:c25828_g1_i1.p1 GENE.c25828_g1_i1~~c25828_g1_i1.p1  ORF type:complete len:434 (-),score=105.47 c25828_g1_i1:265-1518(-)